MSWNKIYLKHKTRFDRIHVESENPVEKSFILEVILEEFAALNKESVERALIMCTNCIHPPRPSRVFFECLKNNIGKV